jgi:hypothetical protein
MSTPPADSPDVAGAVTRLRRGCLIIIFLLVLVALFNFLQYGLNITAIIGSGLLVLALIGFAVISREGKP